MTHREWQLSLTGFGVEDNCMGVETELRIFLLGYEIFP